MIKYQLGEIKQVSCFSNRQEILSCKIMLFLAFKLFVKKLINDTMLKYKRINRSFQ